MSRVQQHLLIIIHPRALCAHQVTSEKEFFAECKKSERVVVHFYRASTWRCEIADRHLGALARKHIETRFIRLDVERVPFLVERLNIFMLPTIMLVKGGKTEHSIIGFDEFGGSDDFDTEVAEAKLIEHGVLLESYV
jgi:hypothetical protein